MDNRKVCFITGTRAEYGILSSLMKLIENDSNLDLQIIVTGAHLSPEYGLTYKEIEKDGFYINEKVEMLLSSDSPLGTAKSMGLAIIGIAEALLKLSPDLVVLLGDRYEMLAAAQASMVCNVPIAHIAGGDTTEGAFDEAIRHSLTKMSHLHFVTNSIAAKRVCQMGENPAYIYSVGSMGIDVIKNVSLLSRDDLEKSLNFQFRKNNLLITFHPVTLDNTPSYTQFEELLSTLSDLGEQTGLIFTKPNADPSSRALIQMIDDFVITHKNATAHTSLGQIRYLSTIACVDAVVGNSSSGLYEVPSFKKPTVNIGDRQKGRIQASSVINCEPNRIDIKKAIEDALIMECTNAINPYGNGDSSEKIHQILTGFGSFKGLLKKKFFEVT